MTALPALAATLRQSLDACVGIGVADPRAAAPPLWPAEDTATVRMRDKRRREFAAGRAAARAAMADLGLPPTAIPMAPDRAPCWPPELCGSISHCASAAIALVARRRDLPGLGIDIEEDTDLPSDLWAEIMTADERNWLHQQPPSEQGRRAKEIFCAKEAIHKLHHPLTGRMLGFHEVVLTLERRSFRARLPIEASDLPEMVAGKILRADGLVLAVLAASHPMAAPHREVRFDC